MKLLHVSDLHIGKRVNGMSMVEDQVHILGQIVAAAKREGVDALLVAGDIYDKASPSAEAVAMFDSFLTELPVTFWLLPFLKPGDVRRYFPEIEIGDDYAAALRAVLNACEIDPTLRNVALSHQLVTSGGLSPQRADDEIKLGGIDAVDVSVYDAFDYVALGHIHRAQRVGRDTVRYAGSPLKYSFGEARYDKSAVLVELGPKAAGDEVGACVSWKLVPLQPLHDMRELRAPLHELLDAGIEELDGAQDYLHITLTDEHPQIDAMARLREVYPNALVLDYENEAILAAREQVRAAVDPDKLDTAELFARFYEEQVGNPMDELQAEIVAKAVRTVEAALGRGADGAEGGAR